MSESSIVTTKEISELTMLSWSKMSTWSDCGTKFQLKYLSDVSREPQGSLIAGIAFHETVEEGQREGLFGEKPEQTKIVELFTTKFNDAIRAAGGPGAVRWGGRSSNAWPNGEDSEWWLHNAPEFLKRTWEVIENDRVSGIEVYTTANGDEGIELTLNVPMGERLLTAKIDELSIDTNTGELVVTDWATGKPGGKSKLQGAFYAEAVERALGLTVGRVRYVYPRGKAWDVRVQEFNPEGLRAFAVESMLTFERALDAAIFVVKPSSFCKSCDVRGGCPIGTSL